MQRVVQLESNPLLQTQLTTTLREIDAQCELLRLRNRHMKQRQKNRSVTLLKLTKEEADNSNKDVINLKNKNDSFNIVSWELEHYKALETKTAAQMQFLEQRIQDAKLQIQEMQAVEQFDVEQFMASTFLVKPSPVPEVDPVTQKCTELLKSIDVERMCVKREQARAIDKTRQVSNRIKACEVSIRLASDKLKQAEKKTEDA